MNMATPCIELKGLKVYLHEDRIRVYDGNAVFACYEEEAVKAFCCLRATFLFSKCLTGKYDIGVSIEHEDKRIVRFTHEDATVQFIFYCYKNANIEAPTEWYAYSLFDL
jgi:hypothetical protein